MVGGLTIPAGCCVPGVNDGGGCPIIGPVDVPIGGTLLGCVPGEMRGILGGICPAGLDCNGLFNCTPGADRDTGVDEPVDWGEVRVGRAALAIVGGVLMGAERGVVDVGVVEAGVAFGAKKDDVLAKPEDTTGWVG